MKKNYLNIYNLIGVLILCVSITSCQKEVDRDDDPNNPPAGSATDLYLDKVYFADSTNGIKDTFYYNAYVYDANKRVTRLNSYSKDDFGVFFLREYYEYVYSGNDTLPSKKFYIAVADNGGFSDTTTNFYTYLPNGRLLTDSAIHRYHQVPTSPATYNSTNTFRYQYGTNKIYAAITFTIDDQPISREESDTLTTDAAMNVLDYKHYYRTDNTEAFIFLRSGSYTYESTPSPFARLSNFKTLIQIPYGESFFYDMQSYNNRRTANESNIQEDLTGNWQYGANGYPLRVRTNTDPTMPGTYEVTLFTYKSL